MLAEFSYTVDFRDAVVKALMGSVEASYQNVFIVNVPPVEGQYDRVIRFALQYSSKPDLKLADGARASYTMTISMEAFDGKNMKLVQRTSISGYGMHTSPLPRFFASANDLKLAGSEALTKSIDGAIQQLSDSAANLLIGGFAEPESPRQL
jgi:hypothetical protein